MRTSRLTQDDWTPLVARGRAKLTYSESSFRLRMQPRNGWTAKRLEWAGLIETKREAIYVVSMLTGSPPRKKESERLISNIEPGDSPSTYFMPLIVFLLSEFLHLVRAIHLQLGRSLHPVHTHQMPFPVVVILSVADQLGRSRTKVEKKTQSAANQLQHQLVTVFAHKEEKACQSKSLREGNSKSIVLTSGE